MFKSLTVVSLVATVALAQTSSLVPSGISDKCSSFLTELNTDTALSKCTGTLSQALAAFAPGTSSASATAVSTALTTLCGSDVNTQCPTSVFASKITAFYSACSEELTTKSNADVVRIYDVLYIVSPMRQAICSKADDGSWCVTAATPAAGTSADAVQAALYTKSGDNVVPNTSTFTTYNLPFLFLNPDTADLCKTCTKNVLNAFITHESDLPYAPGLGNSQLLKTQSDLYKAVQEKCGANFMSGEVKAAGGLSTGNSIIGGSNGALAGAEFSTAAAAFVGFMTLAAIF
ncbi:hypothetical protein D9611_001014 [Ephemerocybe angulata]|uniref:Uncharacterized protein n=1 Tax=Ephemerocybe angulata TaxID=980116 RepID=A0A8H5F6X4_9AGAR|nr:hypothetical protein D9611_001014 [Tulosesus angulatus]